MRSVQTVDLPTHGLVKQQDFARSNDSSGKAEKLLLPDRPCSSIQLLLQTALSFHQLPQSHSLKGSNDCALVRGTERVKVEPGGPRQEKRVLGDDIHSQAHSAACHAGVVNTTNLDMTIFGGDHLQQSEEQRRLPATGPTTYGNVLAIMDIQAHAP